ncbi:pimeloyl-ACP methyl ester carboxylesterase [Spinactinospora alkalitolerans]|uniref:Pimeloyl-ACP methyl ester carboxylesterase n=1 Tax=Spinactinospora alkalitolerans TaxID=687207 RepID=A0A852U419_9ACTN|nr:alpha/beta hydrolase [Spinactinospora alkalitolerans]NYE50235.1 pimeloyl-ACP methyl ester carboxylesterase [Spinactinospora alkalitolerans]
MGDWQLNNTYRSSSGMVRWDRFGNPDGEAVVLLHGTPFSSFIWRGIARALARHHRVHVWDMPGYGLSEKSEDQDLSLAALGGVFAELLEHWRLTRPLVAAHDSGGAIALGAHLLHDAHYRRLALVDAVSLAPWGSPFSRLVGEHAAVFDRLPPPLHGALVREYVNSASGPGLHPATLDALIEPWLADGGQAAFYRQITARLDDQRYTDAMQDRYDTITIPVMVCWGEDDTWVPVERGRELASRIPGARLHTIPGAGHLVHEDGPAELAAALLAFLHDLD